MRLSKWKAYSSQYWDHITLLFQAHWHVCAQLSTIQSWRIISLEWNGIVITIMKKETSNSRDLSMELAYATMRYSKALWLTLHLPPRQPGKVVAVCILSRDGVSSFKEACNYVQWAQSVGFNAVTFRELS